MNLRILFNQNFTVDRCSPLITSMLVTGDTGGGGAAMT